MKTILALMGGLVVVALALAGVALWQVQSASARGEAALPRMARQEDPHIVVGPQVMREEQRTTEPAPRVVESTPAVPRGREMPVRVGEPAREGELRVRRLIVARGVEGREPVGAADTFARADVDRLYAFVELGNRTGEEQKVVVTFEPEGDRADATGHVELNVGEGARWRTWAFTRMMRAGEWDAVVRTLDGDELARTSFTVTDSED